MINPYQHIRSFDLRATFKSRFSEEALTRWPPVSGESVLSTPLVQYLSFILISCQSTRYIVVRQVQYGSFWYIIPITTCVTCLSNIFFIYTLYVHRIVT